MVEGTASSYRAMSLFRQGRQDQARELFAATEAKMKPLPAADRNPLGDGKTTADQLILWLAFKGSPGLAEPWPGN